MEAKLGKPILMTMNMLADPRLPQQTETAVEIIKANLKQEGLIDAWELFTAYAEDRAIDNDDARQLIDDFEDNQLFEIRRMAIQFATEAYFEDLGMNDSTHMVLRLKMLALKDDVDAILHERGYVTPNAIMSKYHAPLQDGLMNRLYDLTIETTTYEAIDDIDVKMLIERELKRRITAEDTLTFNAVIKAAVEQSLAKWNGENTTIKIGRFGARIHENKTLQD